MGGLDSLFNVVTSEAPGYRHAVLAQNFLALVFVDFH
jgi:hypothetical protein